MESEDEDLLNFKALKRFRIYKRKQNDHQTPIAESVQSGSKSSKKSKCKPKSVQLENKSSRKSLAPLPAPKCIKCANVSCIETDGKARLRSRRRNQELRGSDTNICANQQDTDMTNDEIQTEILAKPDNTADSDKPFRTLPGNADHKNKSEMNLTVKMTAKKRQFACSDSLLVNPSADGSLTKNLAADSPQRKRTQTPSSTSPAVTKSKKNAASFETPRSPTAGSEKLTASKKDEGVECGTKAEGETEKNRCPFCQMPLGVLASQWLNQHVMECMDSPLKTTEECPAGLKCESTIHSHYRRFTHLRIAHHLASLWPVEHLDIDHNDEFTKAASQQSEGSRNGTSRQSQASRNGTSRQSQASRNGTSRQSQASRNRTPGQSQGSRNRSKQQKRKLVSPNAVREHSGSESGPSQSQGSRSSSRLTCSIKSYFSPSGKKASSPDKLLKKTSDKELEDFDPVLKLLVMSDSDSDASMDRDINRGLKTEADETDGCDTGDWEDEPLQQDLSEAEAEGDKAADVQEVDGVSENGGGDFVPEAGTEEVLSDTGLMKNVDSLLSVDMACSDSSALRLDQTPHVTNLVNPSIPVTAYSVRRQTSLFSFFRPHCHLANAPKKHVLSVTKTVPGPSLPKQNLGKSKISSHAAEKAPLVKSASETVTLLRVPSPPPPCVQVKNVHHAGNAKPPPMRGRPSTASASTSWQKSSGRQCPFYKKLPGTAITVDAFSYGEIPGCQAYVLTHFHYDHYQGLTKRFSQPIFCSSVTANLVEKQIGVASRWINRLPLNTPSQVAGVWLTLMEANHCPGAVIILFELPSGRKLLHTGDFRADPCMEQYPPLVNVSVDELYLDTTYCDPAYAFPSQREAIQFAVSTAKKAMEQEPRTLVVCGAYTIGKERIFMALAEALQTKVCVQSAKKQVLDCLDDKRLKAMVTLKWTEGSVHVLPMRQLNARGLQDHLEHCPQFTSVLAFEPTGWTHTNKALSLDTLRPKFSCHRITIYGVPYSEHSSFLEMKRFVQFVRPKKILPTVNNGSPASRRKMEAIFAQWLAEGNAHTDSMMGSAKESALTQQSLGAWLNG